MTIRISGTGSALPEKIITNDDLSKIVADSSVISFTIDVADN